MSTLTTRGRWRFRPDMAPWFGARANGAWQLEDYDWWLYRRTGADLSLRWCGYCWTPPYRWWMLYQGDPAGGVILTPPRWWQYWESGRRVTIVAGGHHGQCTHQHNLSGAMRVSEKAFARHIMKTLADL